MTVTVSRHTHHQNLLAQSISTIVPNLPTTNRLFSYHTKRPSLPVLILNRMGYGPRPNDIKQFQKFGTSSEQQIANFIEWQLNPETIDDSIFEKQLEATQFSTIQKSLASMIMEHLAANNDYEHQTLPLRELERLIFLRAIYSQKQLVEVLAEFWHDYFNIYAWQSPDIAATMMSFDRDVIREHLLGNYLQFVDAVLNRSEWKTSHKRENLSPWLEIKSLDDTAQRVCESLCRRFISDQPSPQIVQSSMQVFLSNKMASDQLKQVIRHIFLSDDFQMTWGQKVKRPFETIVSALRATNADLSIDMNTPSSDSFMWHYHQIGQAPFACPEPGGYPDVKSHWQNNKHLRMRWRMINWLVDLQDKNGRFLLDLQSQTPPFRKLTATKLVDYWVLRIFGYKIEHKDRQLLITYLANDQHHNAHFSLTSQTNKKRLRETIALMLNCPQFQVR